MSNAYEKMLQNGSAFKQVDMTMSTKPNMMEAQGVGENINDLGKQVKKETKETKDDFTDYTEFDNIMESKVQALKNKMKGKKTNQPINESKEITSLKKRVKRLEEAMMVIMETHSKLVED